MNDHNSSKIKQTAAALAVASALAALPGIADAAGLGKIRVLSGMGQPLRAELELNATREELNGMVARLAAADVFRQAGVDYASPLMDLQFAVDKRSDGKSVVKVSSSKPVNEPFLDFLVELNWPAGRLVREYTFLLDPPEVAVRSSGKPVSVAEAKVIDNLPAQPAPQAAPAVAAEKPVAKSEPAAKPQAPKPALPPAEKKAGGRTVTVKAGDTLNKIAAAHKPEGVSLEQMLVGLYRANQDAFFDGNINRLKKGSILSVPDKDAAAALSTDEARAELQAQARDWNSYRQKLAATAAAAPAREAAASQATGGKVTPRVEDKAAPAQAAKDQVKVSRTELGGKAGKGTSEEDKVAMDRALKDAQDRLMSLEKNINDMQKLLEMKNQKLAELEQQVSGKGTPPAPAAEVKPPVVAKPAEVPPPAKPEAEAKPAPETKAPEAAPAEAKPPAPPPKPKVVLPPPEEEEPPGLLETLLADPLPLAGGGALLALLAAYLMYRRRRPSEASEAGGNTTLAVPETGIGSYQPNGQSIDTSQTPPQSSEFSQAGPGTIDTDEVDPVAEAEVYMAYGRDAQAEEILLEALQKDTQRTAVHVKLLEIYANRKSAKQFETLAEELFAQTGGHGTDWAKAAALGARLDPANPLYRGPAARAGLDAPTPVAAVPEEPFDPDATMVIARPAEAPAIPVVEAAAEPLPTLDMAASPAPVEVHAEAQGAADSDEALGLDFDLTPAAPAAVAAPAPETEPPVEDLAGGLEFDLGSASLPVIDTPTAEVAAEPVADDAAHSLDFDLGAIGVEEPAKPADEAAALHVDLPEVAEDIVAAPAVAAAEEAADFDISLDFDLPQAAAAPAVKPALAVEEPTELPAEITLPPSSVSEAQDLAFDIELDAPAEQPAVSEPTFDLSSINLDLAVPVDADELPEPLTEIPELAEAAPADEPIEVVTAVDASDPLREEVSTKLDLAKAYEEMGDLEGARELLAEVVADGPADLAAEAKDILVRIGS